MRRIFFIISVISCLLIPGCEDDRLQLPKVQATPTQLNFTSVETTRQIILTVTAPVAIRWTITHKPEWIQVERNSGTVGDGPIMVFALTETLLPQTLSDKIQITTTTGKIEIPVTLTVTTSTAIILSPSPLVFDYTENAKQFTVKNSGNQQISWQLQSSATYLSVTPSSGTLNPDQSVALTVSVNRSNLETKTYSESLTLNLNGVKNNDIGVTVNNYKEQKLLLEGTVADAEYDRTSDNLIVIIGNKLYKINPVTNAMSSVELAQPGSCVSIGKNGQYAVVGHELSVSLVDLTAMKVDNVYPTSADAMDIVLAPNNWAYVFPKGYGWDKIRCINLADGTELLSTGPQLYAGMKARLHPSGDYIYTADNGLTPNDAQKADIRAGQANVLYDSRYHGEHQFAGNLWMADDGSRMFTRGGDVFKLSEDPSLDITYDKSLTSPVQTLDHSSLSNKVCAVYFDFYDQAPKGEVQIFSGDLLAGLGTKPLPGFLVGQPGHYQFAPSEGVYGFFNSSGTKFIVCVRSKMMPLVSEIDWAVTTISID